MDGLVVRGDKHHDHHPGEVGKGYDGFNRSTYRLLADFTIAGDADEMLIESIQ